MKIIIFLGILLYSYSSFAQSKIEIFNFMIVAFEIEEIKDIVYSTKTGSGKAVVIFENEELTQHLTHNRSNYEAETFILPNKNFVIISKNYMYPSMMFESKICIVFQRIMWDKIKNEVLLKFSSLSLSSKALPPDSYFKARIELKMKRGKWVIKKQEIKFPDKKK